MKNSVRIMALALLMSVVCWFAIGLVDATQINIINQCSQTISGCQTDFGGQVTNSYALGSGASQLIDVGTTWLGVVIWGYPGSSADSTDCNNALPQADHAEFIIAGSSNQDYYDISNVNAYDLPLKIAPTSPVQSSGTTCGSPSCTINNLNSFCQPPNILTGGPGYGCYNVDGTSIAGPTGGTTQFANAAPQAISSTTDTGGKVYRCPTGTNYEVVFCP